MGNYGLSRCDQVGGLFLCEKQGLPIELMVSTLVRLSCPIAIVGSHYPVSTYLTLAGNAATYAVVGLMVKPCGGGN
jgi:hypothetical protein